MANNQQVLPNINWPIIAPGWCIPANYTDAQAFQKFIDDWLTQATINALGLGDIPYQLQLINQTLISLQNQINANNIFYDQGEVPINTLNGVTTVNLNLTAPNSSYMVTLTAIDDGTAITSNPPEISLVPNSRSQTQFQFRSNNAPTSWRVLWSVTTKY